MSHLEFNESEHDLAFLKTYDFHDYDDPVVQAYTQWDISSSEWNRTLRYTSLAGDRSERRETPLADATERYADMFDATATLLSAESIAVPALEKLIRSEHRIRTKNIHQWHNTSPLPRPHVGYFRDLAMAYANPRRAILTPEMARLAFINRLDAQSNRVLNRSRQPS